LLKKGGRLVYSTCSFNPLENEAVVAAVLQRYPMQINLVDVSSEVHPDLKYRPGLTKWKVYFKPNKDVETKWFDSYKTIPDRRK